MKTKERISAETAYAEAATSRPGRHNFFVGDRVYHRTGYTGRLTVIDIDGNFLTVQSLLGKRLEFYYRALGMTPLHGTAVGNLSDVQIRREMYSIECNVEPPTSVGDNDTAWKAFEDVQNWYACLRVEQLDRQHNGGIWAMED